MKRDKILFLSRRYLPEIGGVELHLQQLIKTLGSDYQFTVVAEQDQADLLLTEKIGQVKVFRISLPKYQTNKFAIWWWWLRHLKLIWQADVIHIHDVYFWLLPYRFLFFWKKWTITFHGYEGTQNPNWKQKCWHQLAEIMTDGNLCIGGFHQVWYGVQPTAISFGAVGDIAIAKEKKAKNQTSKLVFVGRLAEDTGILVYLEALRILCQRHTIECDVYGDGPDRLLAEELVKQYRLPVTFYGFVEPTEIHWGRYDLAFVSRYLAILESMMAKVPVVAQYNVPIKRDYLKLTPFSKWIEIGQTTNEIVTATENWLSGNEVEAAEKISTAHRWVTTQTWQKMAMTYQELWNNK